MPWKMVPLEHEGDIIPAARRCRDCQHRWPHGYVMLNGVRCACGRYLTVYVGMVRVEGTGDDGSIFADPQAVWWPMTQCPLFYEEPGHGQYHQPDAAEWAEDFCGECDDPCLSSGPVEEPRVPTSVDIDAAERREDEALGRLGALVWNMRNALRGVARHRPEYDDYVAESGQEGTNKLSEGLTLLMRVALQPSDVEVGQMLLDERQAIEERTRLEVTRVARERVQ